MGINNALKHASSLQCRLRNFTDEACSGNKEAEGVQNVEDMHSYWFGTGVHDQLKDWDVEESHNSECDKQTGNKKWVLLARREGNDNIWHKLMEL